MAKELGLGIVLEMQMGKFHLGDDLSMVPNYG